MTKVWDLSVFQMVAIVAGHVAFAAAAWIAKKRYEWVRMACWYLLSIATPWHELCNIDGACEEYDWVAFGFATLLLWTVGSNVLLTGVWDQYWYEAVLEVFQLVVSGLMTWASDDDKHMWPYFTMLALGVILSATSRYWNTGLHKEDQDHWFMPIHHKEVAATGALAVNLVGLYVVLQSVGVAFGHAARDTRTDSYANESFRALGYLGWGFGSALMIYSMRAPNLMPDYHIGADL